MTRVLPAAVLSFAVVALAGAPPVDAQAADPVAESQRLFANQDWPASIQAHEALVRDRPTDAQAWLRLGISLQGAGRYADSIRPLEEAARQGAPAAGPVQFRLAKAHAKTGNVPNALGALRKAADGGFGLVASVDSDADLASLHADAGFAALRTAIDRNARPCQFRPESRQLDFWIGEWDVTQTGAPAGREPSKSRIESVENELRDREFYEPHWVTPVAATTSTSRTRSAGSSSGWTTRAASITTPARPRREPLLRGRVSAARPGERADEEQDDVLQPGQGPGAPAGRAVDRRREDLDRDLRPDLQAPRPLLTGARGGPGHDTRFRPSTASLRSGASSSARRNAAAASVLRPRPSSRRPSR